MEIERKFLIDGFPDGLELIFHGHVEQCYLSISPPEVRASKSVPCEDTPGEVYCRLTIKGEGDLAREEIETEITEEQFDAIAQMTGRDPIVKDFRVYDLYDGFKLEVSLVDGGKPESFMYAEVEFPSIEAANAFVPPDYLGEELTHRPGARMKNYWLNGKID